MTCLVLRQLLSLEKTTKTQQEVDDFLYELPETMPDLELGDELTNALGTEGQNLFD